MGGISNMSWTNVTKPNTSGWTNTNPSGRTQYDQADIIYDSADVYYDGAFDSWTDISKPVTSGWTNINKPT